MDIALSNDDRGMSQQVTYLCQRNPRTNQPSRAGVSQIVDVEVLDPGTTAGRLEAPFDRPDSRSVLPCEYPGACGAMLCTESQAVHDCLARSFIEGN